MSYLTRHSIEVLFNTIPDQVILSHFRDICSGAAYAIDNNGYCIAPTKWTYRNNDLRQFSKFYPELIFVLTGEGEESGDIWKEYYMNGKCQFAPGRIAFDDFDMSKLD